MTPSPSRHWYPLYSGSVSSNWMILPRLLLRQTVANNRMKARDFLEHWWADGQDYLTRDYDKIVTCRPT